MELSAPPLTPNLPVSLPTLALTPTAWPSGLAFIVGAVAQVAGGEHPCGANLLQRRLVTGDGGALEVGLVYFGPGPTSVVRSPTPS